MFSHSISRVIHDERQLEIERQLRFRAAVAARSRHGSNARSVRKAIGRSVVRIGQAIAADGQARTVGELAARH